MNITKQAATITQTVSAATPAAEVAVVSSAATTTTGVSAASTAVETASGRRCRSSDLGNDVPSRALMPLSVRRLRAPEKRADMTNWPSVHRAHRTGGALDARPLFRINRTETRASPSWHWHLMVSATPSYDHPGARQIQGISWRVFMAVETKSVSKTSPREVL